MSAPAPSMFTPAAKAMAEKLGLKMGKANLDAFAEQLTELARADKNIIAVTSDSRGSGKLAPYGKELPKQIVEVGIGEIAPRVGKIASRFARSILKCRRGIEHEFDDTDQHRQMSSIIQSCHTLSLRIRSRPHPCPGRNRADRAGAP